MSTILVAVQPEKYCPPCGFFVPEIVERSITWGEECCENSAYVIDCVHREVCSSRSQADEYQRGYRDGLRANINYSSMYGRLGVVSE